jgi:putative DNA primase/helicase
MTAELETPGANWPQIDQLPTPRPLYPKNDSERAVQFANYFGSDLRYVASWKSWLRWDGTRWTRDEDGAIMRLAQEMPKLLLTEASTIDDCEKRAKAAGEAIRAGDAARLHAMIQLAGTQSSIATTPQMFDADPYLLSVQNGVIDLCVGSFREARKKDYLRKQAGTEYSRDAKCPRWLDFLNTIFQGNAELIEFIQIAVGYTLTGATQEQALFFLHGTGRNGKSTFTETLQALLGSYA